MIASALQVVPQTWPALLKPHPWAVLTFVLVGAAMFAYAAFGHKEPEKPSMKAKGDIVRSPQIGAVHGDVYMGDHSPVRTEPLADPKTEIPRLVIHGPKLVHLDSESRVFSRCTQATVGVPGIIVRVENPAASIGERGLEAKGVRARINFFRPDGELITTSEYAHWLDIFENRTNIPAGESKTLVVGLYSDPRVWHVFSNKDDAPLSKAHTFHQVHAAYAKLTKPLEPEFILLNPSITAEITLISKYDSSTLARKSLTLSAARDELTGMSTFTYGMLDEA